MEKQREKYVYGKERKKNIKRRKICVWENEREWLKKKWRKIEKGNGKKDMRGMNQVKEK
jgi:hypothetical protein